MHPTDDIRVDASTFVTAMNRFIALKKLTFQEGIRVQGGLLADELVRGTPSDHPQTARNPLTVIGPC